MMKSLTTSNYSDSELTMRALEGHRDAFGHIVSRYQSLVCSLAYSATGSLSQSEDLAQETFIAAWKGLRTLREPEKLRSWLCGIARNIIASAARHKKQEPAVTAQPIDAALDQPSPELLPVDRVISSEEESILWRSLEHIPQIYREPLILFYREGKSIECVARQLELSEEAVKQRLSRGRNLLKMEVESFVETALSQSKPGRNFTSAVLAGLPDLSISTGASTIVTAASKASAIAKTGLIGGLLTPIISAVSSVVSVIGFVKSAHSEHERSLMKKSAAMFYSIFILGISGAAWANDSLLSPIIIFSTVAACFANQLVTAAMVKRLRRRIQMEEGVVEEAPRSGLPFYGPECKGFKWNVYGGVMGLSFGNPFALLAIFAAMAHDTVALFAILAVCGAMFILGSQTIIRKPETSWTVVRVIPIAIFPLLLIAIYLRWEMWMRQPAWPPSGILLLFEAVGFLNFVVFVIHWLVKRNQ